MRRCLHNVQMQEHKPQHNVARWKNHSKTTPYNTEFDKPTCMTVYCSVSRRKHVGSKVHIPLQTTTYATRFESPTCMMVYCSVFRRKNVGFKVETSLQNNLQHRIDSPTCMTVYCSVSHRKHVGSKVEQPLQQTQTHHTRFESPTCMIVYCSVSRRNLVWLRQKSRSLLNAFTLQGRGKTTPR